MIINNYISGEKLGGYTTTIIIVVISHFVLLTNVFIKKLDFEEINYQHYYNHKL